MKDKRSNRTGCTLTAAVLLVLLGVAFIPVNAKAAPPPLLSEFCPKGSLAGQCKLPRGLGVAPNGNLYVADQENRRIDQFTIWGEFVRAWGWDVVASGPDETVADKFEICDVAANPSDVCQVGASGSGVGQFGIVEGISADSAGNVYVADWQQRRVQKFSPEGEFLLMIGGGVDQGPVHPGDLCSAQFVAEGDTCGAGTVGTPGSGEGKFGEWPVANFIGVGPGDNLYVGDGERIQIFKPDGEFKSQISLTGKGFVSGLAANAAGDLYASFATQPNGGFTAKPGVSKLGPNGEVLCTADALNPRSIATNSDGELFVIDGTGGSTQVGRYLASCTEDPSYRFSLGFDTFDGALGLATTSACGIAGTDIFLDAWGGFFVTFAFVARYGSSPDPSICPPPAVPPSITAQFATAADSGGATLKARINPHFWTDTRYYVQYGTGKCSEGGCDLEKPASPGSLLTKDVKDAEVTSADVFLEGLAPDTTYHYRFVAVSGGGGPVFGVGGTEAEVGKEASFHTLSPATEANTACPNQTFRAGASARLLDCRAYELVSPLDKNNGDVSVFKNGFAQAAVDGERMTFSSSRAFADPEAAPLTSQFLAERHAGQEWATRSISLPRDSQALYPNTGTYNIQYKAFSESLCSGWALQGNDVAMVPGAPARVPNLYRRELCEPTAYELLTSTPPPGFGNEIESIYYPEIQGASADESHSVFRADAALAVSEGSPRPPFFCRSISQASTVSYRWLRNGVPIAGATASTYTPTPADEGTAVQCQVSAGSSEGTAVETSEAQLVAPLGPVKAPALPRRIVPGSAVAGAEASGTPAVGQTLTCEPGQWSGAPIYSHRWLRNGAPIAGAIAPVYALVSADRGTAVQCELSATNAGGSVAADSPALVIDASPPSPSTPPSTSGTLAVGETLTCNPGTWSGSPTFTYQWLRGGANIATATATSSTYTLAAADEGKVIQCRLTVASAEPAVAAATAGAVVAPPPAITPPALNAPVTVSGSALVGETLTCDTGTWTGAPTFARKWLRNGANILGQVGETYKPTATDLGKAIQCQVTGTNAGGATVALSSSRYVNVATPATPDVRAYSVFQVYETSPGGELNLVSVLPDGTPADTHAAAGTKQGGEGESLESSLFNAVAADGERIFWTATDESLPVSGGPGFGDQTGKLYLRLNATAPQSEISGGQCTEAAKACTIEVSGGPRARFIAADPQGSRVIYVRQPDIDNNSGRELLEADIEESGGQVVATSRLIADGVRGVMGTAEDAGRVYFVSTEKLAGTNSHGDEAVAGAPNLYLHEVGVGPTFVGTLSILDAGTNTIGLSGFASQSPVSTLPNYRTSRVNSDGLRAAFTSAAPLTGYDNTDAQRGGPDAEVFVFDAVAGELVCVSCKPSEARPTGGRHIGSATVDLYAAAQIPPWVSQTHPGNALSANGKRLFFDSYDSLVPGDANGKADVYQWEAPGEGDCTEARSSFSEANGGCLSLISSGESATDSGFLDATPSGSDVFFTTQASLLPQDYGLVDVYDARVNGGLPGPVASAPSCEGEACQGTPAAPNDPTPASSAFQGAGNVRDGGGTAKPRCAKGKARKKGRCVKKKAKKQRAGHNRRNAR